MRIERFMKWSATVCYGPEAFLIFFLDRADRMNSMRFSLFQGKVAFCNLLPKNGAQTPGRILAQGASVIGSIYTSSLFKIGN